MPSTGVPSHVVPRSTGMVAPERDRVALARQLQVGRYLDPWGAPYIVWVHSHSLVRGYKVILNLYDIFPSRLNGCLAALGMGGAYHSGIEVGGTEFAFGGHPSDDLGIMTLPRPLHVLHKEAEEAMREGTDADGSAAASLEWIPPLRSRTVVGWWMGPLPQLEQVLAQLQDEDFWRGSTYRLLSRNCNHFARAMCEALLRSPHFKPAPGRSTPDKMVPPEVTRLTSCAMSLGCCCSCAVRRLNAGMPIAPHNLQIFHGKPRTTGRAAPWFRRDGCRAISAAAVVGVQEGRASWFPAPRGQRLGSGADARASGPRPRRARTGSMLAAAAAVAAAIAAAEQAEAAAKEGAGEALEAGAKAATEPPQRQSMSRTAATAAGRPLSPVSPASPPPPTHLELAVCGGSDSASGGGGMPGEGNDLAGGSGSRRASSSGALRTPGHSVTSVSRRGCGRISTVTEADSEAEVDTANETGASPRQSLSRITTDGGGGGNGGDGIYSTAASMTASEGPRPSLPMPPLAALPDTAVAPASLVSPAPSRLAASKPHPNRRSSRRVFPDPRVDPAASEAAEPAAAAEAADGSPHLIPPRPSWTSGHGREPTSPGDITATSHSCSAAVHAATTGSISGGSTEYGGGQRLSVELLQQHEEREEQRLGPAVPRRQASGVSTAGVGKPAGRLTPLPIPLLATGRLSTPAPALAAPAIAATVEVHPAAGGRASLPADASAKGAVATAVATVSSPQQLKPQQPQLSQQHAKQQPQHQGLRSPPHSPPQPQEQSQEQAGSAPRPWSVLSGGFVDLLFMRSPRPTAEPPPGMPNPEDGGVDSLPSPSRRRAATHVGATSTGTPATAAMLDWGRSPSGARAEPAAKHAVTVSGEAVVAGGAGGAHKTATPASPPLQSIGVVRLHPPSPAGRYEILAAVQEVAKPAGRDGAQPSAREREQEQPEQRRASSSQVHVRTPSRGVGAG